MTSRAFWLDTEPEPIFAVLHPARGPEPSRTAALIVPTFGLDNDFSYRPRRDWADRLAASGVTSLRFDFPGSENSAGSPLTPGRFQSWLDATTAAAGWLRTTAGCERLVAIGIGLGGQVAHLSAVAGAPIDDLILWAVRASGRAYLRELRAHAAVAIDPADAEREVTQDDIAPGLGGFVMSAETAAAVGAIDLTKAAPLSQPERRRVLLIGRDAHGIDQKLHDHFASSGVALTALEVDDFRCAVGLPDLLLSPTSTITQSIDWTLDPSASSLEPVAHATPGPVAPDTDAVEIVHDGVRIRERIVDLSTSAGRLIGIVSEPVERAPAPHCLTVLNAGSLRHTGPYRIFVEVARLAAAQGTPAFRFDLPGLGDSDGHAGSIQQRSGDSHETQLAVIPEVYDRLESLGVAARFVPTGLCLGGYMAIRATLSDPRSVAAISVNPPSLRWSETQQQTWIRGLVAVAGPEVAVTEHSVRRWPKPLQGLVDRAVHARYVIDADARRRLAKVDLLWRLEHRGDLADIGRMIDLYGATGARFLFAFAEDEMLRRMLVRPELKARLNRWPDIRVEHLPTTDHNLAPRRAQKLLFDLLSGELSELERVAPLGDAGEPPTGQP